MSSLRDAKFELRASLRDASDQRSGAPELSSLLVTELHRWEVWNSARSVAGFWALPGEPQVLDPWPGNKKIALPRVVGEHLTLHWVDGPASLVKGRFGILEPPDSAPIADVRALDLILVPGVAFDHGGGRLGRGRGYYDRLLAGTPAFKVGVCFDSQIVSKVPCEPHDIRMDAVITPSGMVR